jgi:7,8-dihydroneopterin aldolase/epimerase/oxygenase
MFEYGEPCTMSCEITQAFDHPDARSRATSQASPLDRISVRDHIVEVEIGAFQAERGKMQRICFNIVVEVRPLCGAVDDDVDKILSYDKVTEAIAIALGEERLNLLETLAARIAERILWEPQAVRAFVRIEKLDRGPGALGVEIVRSAPEETGSHDDEDRPHPLVLFLSNQAINAPHLKTWIDQIVDTGLPALICLGAADTVAPQSKSVLAQRRIDLLAIEQNAWVLAGRDKRCVVVETRTELEWALKNGQISVWAPSKMVLDAVDGPATGEQDSLKLALWFAEEMDAARFVSIGTSVAQLEHNFDVTQLEVSDVQF